MADPALKPSAVQANTKATAPLPDEILNDERNKVSPRTRDQVAWLKQWLSDPATHERMAQNMYDSLNLAAPGAKPLSNVNAGVQKVYSDEAAAALAQALANVSTVSIAESTSPEALEKKGFLGLAGSYNDNLKKALDVQMPGTVGVYNRLNHALGILDGADDGTGAHELTHASMMDRYMASVPYVVRSLDKGKIDKFTNMPEYREYLKDPVEIYPELMSIRYKANLTPGQYVTPEMMEGIQKSQTGSNIFEKMDPEKVRMLLNTLAQNGQAQQPNTA